METLRQSSTRSCNVNRRTDQNSHYSSNSLSARSSNINRRTDQNSHYASNSLSARSCNVYHRTDQTSHHDSLSAQSSNINSRTDQNNHSASLYCEKCYPSDLYRSKSWIQLNEDISFYLSYLIFTDYQKMLQSQIPPSAGKHVFVLCL
jgi:hypothetical protein